MSARSKRDLRGLRGADARLEVERADPQRVAGPVGLEIGPPDEPVADEQRQDVVAVLPLVTRLVDLDDVAEAEEALGERPVPQQVVERREQHRAARLTVEPGVGGHEHVGAVVFDPEPAQGAVRDERVDVRPQAGNAAPQPVVLLHARFGERASTAHGADDEPAQPLLLGRHR